MNIIVYILIKIKINFTKKVYKKIKKAYKKFLKIKLTILN